MHSDGYVVRVHSAEIRPIENLSALAAQINAAHEKAETAIDERLELYVLAGRELLRAKAEVVRRSGKQRGTWLVWLRKSCPHINRMKAWRLMRFAEGSATGPATPAADSPATPTA
jgi:hypothetical protein